MLLQRQHHNYGGGNQFNIESIVLNVNAPSRFGIASSATTRDGVADKEDYEGKVTINDIRIKGIVSLRLRGFNESVSNADMGI